MQQTTNQKSQNGFQTKTTGQTHTYSPTTTIREPTTSSFHAIFLSHQQLRIVVTTTLAIK